MRVQRPITGSIQPKDGKLYAVINEYVDGKRKPNWIDTGCKPQGGKRKAQEFLQKELVKRNEQRNKPTRLKDASADMLFVDYMRMWLKTKRNVMEKITYQSYEERISKSWQSVSLSLIFSIQASTGLGCVLLANAPELIP